MRPEHVTAYERAYGPDGDWVRLFRRDPAYVRTALLHDRENPLRYVTVDHWQSRAAYLEFRTRFRAEFAAIDATCETFTRDERHVGDFDLLVGE